METGLLSEIHEFLRETGMSKTYFGKRAVGNSELVSRLEVGKTVTLKTASTIRIFIADERRKRASVAA